MQSRISSTITLVAGLSFAIALMLFFSLLVGCDSNEKANKTVAEAGPAETPRPIAVSSPTPSLPASEAITEVPIVPVEESPRIVSYEEAEAAYRDRDYGEAQKLFSMYTQQKMENPWGHYMLGLSAWKSASYELAESAFARALELAPEHVKSMLNLSRVFLETDRPEEARTQIETALEIDPSFGVAYRLKGRALHELGQLADAEEAYRAAIRIDNRDAWSMNNLGLVLIEQDFFELAIPPLARATELRDDVAVFFNNLGMALERSHHFRAAEVAYGEAVAIDEAYEKATLNLARVEAVEEDSTLGPIDLTQFARDFEAEIISWSDEDVPREEPIAQDESAVLESVVEENSIENQIPE